MGDISLGLARMERLLVIFVLCWCCSAETEPRMLNWLIPAKENKRLFGNSEEY